MAKKTDASLRDMKCLRVRKNPGCTVYQSGLMSSMFRIGTHRPRHAFARLSPAWACESSKQGENRFQDVYGQQYLSTKTYSRRIGLGLVRVTAVN
jgi:hypothetical protein